MLTEREGALKYFNRNDVSQPGRGGGGIPGQHPAPLWGPVAAAPLSLHAALSPQLPERWSQEPGLPVRNVSPGTTPSTQGPTHWDTEGASLPLEGAPPGISETSKQMLGRPWVPQANTGGRGGRVQKAVQLAELPQTC